MSDNKDTPTPQMFLHGTGFVSDGNVELVSDGSLGPIRKTQDRLWVNELALPPLRIRRSVVAYKNELKIDDIRYDFSVIKPATPKADSSHISLILSLITVLIFLGLFAVFFY